MTKQQLPPGPRWPSLIQTTAWWNRPIALLERCRARYGKRFTLRLLVQVPGEGRRRERPQPREGRQIF